MLFKELPKGKIFTFLGQDGHRETAIKSGDRHALILKDGEEVKIHLTKSVDLPAPIRAGEFALDKEGKPLIAERLRNGSYACEYIECIGRKVMSENEISIIDLNKRDSGETQNELYIILKRAKKAVKHVENALEMGESIIEEL